MLSFRALQYSEMYVINNIAVNTIILLSRRFPYLICFCYDLVIKRVTNKI